MHVYKMLVKCHRENRAAEIIYLDRNGKTSQRKIYINKLDENKVSAYCMMRKQNRVFAIENILAVMPVRKKEAV